MNKIVGKYPKSSNEEVGRFTIRLISLLRDIISINIESSLEYREDDTLITISFSRDTKNVSQHYVSKVKFYMTVRFEYDISLKTNDLNEVFRRGEFIKSLMTYEEYVASNKEIATIVELVIDKFYQDKAFKTLGVISNGVTLQFAIEATPFTGIASSIVDDRYIGATILNVEDVSFASNSVEGLTQLKTAFIASFKNANPPTNIYTRIYRIYTSVGSFFVMLYRTEIINSEQDKMSIYVDADTTSTVDKL